MAERDDDADDDPSDLRGRVLGGRVRLGRWREAEAAWIRFDAQWLAGDRPAAVWLLDPEGDDADAMAARLCGLQLCIGLPEHPAVTTILGSGWTDDGLHWLATARPPATSLASCTGPVAPERLVGWGRRLLSALAFLAEHGIVHGGIRPAAVGLDPDSDEIVLGGFSERTQLVQLGTVASPAARSNDAWASPEQIAGRPIDPTTDLYSTGLLLYVLASGRPPAAARAELHAGGGGSGHVPTAVFDLLSRMAAYERSARIASAERAAAELDAATASTRARSSTGTRPTRTR